MTITIYTIAKGLPEIFYNVKNIKVDGNVMTIYTEHNIIAKEYNLPSIKKFEIS